MKKLLLILLASLTGCAHTINNPYDTFSANQLANVSSEQLCATVNNRYKPSANVIKELIKRGYKDCSESEIFCRENADLKPGTQAYATCRIERDQYALNVAQARQAAYYQNMRLWQNSRPQNIYVHHSYSYF
jgi:hypothetical protein